MDDQNLAADPAALKKRMAHVERRVALMAAVIGKLPVGLRPTGEVTVKDGNGRVLATLEADATGVTRIKLAGPGKPGPVGSG